MEIRGLQASQTNRFNNTVKTDFTMPSVSNNTTTKTCPACDRTFECNPTGNCWCGTITVSLEMLAALRDRHNDCLCNTCLIKAAAGKLPQRSIHSAHAASDDGSHPQG